MPNIGIHFFLMYPHSYVNTPPPPNVNSMMYTRMVTILFSSGKRYYPAALRMVSEHTDDDPVITHIKDNILVSSFSVVIVKYIQEHSWDFLSEYFPEIEKSGTPQ